MIHVYIDYQEYTKNSEQSYTSVSIYEKGDTIALFDSGDPEKDWRDAMIFLQITDNKEVIYNSSCDHWVQDHKNWTYDKKGMLKKIE